MVSVGSSPLEVGSSVVDVVVLAVSSWHSSVGSRVSDEGARLQPMRNRNARREMRIPISLMLCPRRQPIGAAHGTSPSTMHTSSFGGPGGSLPHAFGGGHNGGPQGIGVQSVGAQMNCPRSSRQGPAPHMTFRHGSAQTGVPVVGSQQIAKPPTVSHISVGHARHPEQGPSPQPAQHGIGSQSVGRSGIVGSVVLVPLVDVERSPVEVVVVALVVAPVTVDVVVPLEVVGTAPVAPSVDVEVVGEGSGASVVVDSAGVTGPQATRMRNNRAVLRTLRVSSHRPSRVNG